jgi:hypothetical protein
VGGSVGAGAGQEIVAEDDFVPAAAFAGAGIGFDQPVVGLKAEGAEGWEVHAHATLPDEGCGNEAGDGFEGLPRVH